MEIFRVDRRWVGKMVSLRLSPFRFIFSPCLQEPSPSSVGGFALDVALVFVTFIYFWSSVVNPAFNPQPRGPGERF
jgi:hypothetical protein